MSLDLTVLDVVPDGLFNTPADQLLQKLAGPTLLFLPGLRSPPLFISVLLHVNETSGWQALCQLLGKREPLARSRLGACFCRKIPSFSEF